MEALTKEQALKEGYTHWGYEGEVFQSIKELCDLEPSDFRPGAVLVLFEKYPWSPSTNLSRIKDAIIDLVSEDNDEESGDDTESVFGALSLIDDAEFEQITRVINTALRGITYYNLTTIRLKLK